MTLLESNHLRTDTAPRRAAADSARAARDLTVAYLVNQYPMTTQSFIRREIQGLEALGVKVERYALRRWATPLVDVNDRAEQAKTRVVLDEGAIGLLLAVLRTLLGRPGAFLRAFAATYRLGVASGKGILKHFVYLAEACVLLGWLRKSPVPHVHVHFGTNSTTVAMLCRMMGGPPYSFTCHGPEEFDGPRALGLTEKIEHCAFVVGISDFGCSQIFRWSRFEDWHKVKQVHCGVDAMFLDIPATPPPAAPRLVNVGRIDRAKGQFFLVQAVAQLIKEGLDVEMVFVGDGRARERVQAYIDDQGLRDRIRITGWMSNEDVRKEILAARALAMPSFAEGLPLVIMEALALHRPVLSTYVAGIPELVKPGVCGWLVPPGSIEDLKRAIREILATPPAQLEKLGGAGAALVAERHDSRIEAAKLAALFEEFTTNSPQPKGDA